MNYERDTKLAYLTADRAATYDERQTRSWTWARWSTQLERRAVRRLLRTVTADGRILVLDVPCGTGVAAGALSGFNVEVTAFDISIEMIRYARRAYAASAHRFVCADVTRLPLIDRSFDCVLTLGFMHRVPADVRRHALAELTRVSRRFIVMSCSIDSVAQKTKHRILAAASRRHVPAPSPVSLSQLQHEFSAARLALRQRVPVAPFLSSEQLFLLQRQ